MIFPDTPVTIKILDVDQYIRLNRCGQVTSHKIIEPSSTTFADDGFFSEEIFGNVGSPERLVQVGYIELNTTILHPLFFKNIVKLGSIYVDILESRSYAIFDREKKTFVLVPDNDPNGRTGIGFFIENYSELEFKSTGSTQREDRINVLKKYAERGLIKRMLVEPAGLRDIRIEGDRTSQDDINKLYTTLLSYAMAMPAGTSSQIYDVLRLNIQKKIVEIYEYIENLLTGKHGFLQGKYARRQIARGTRNVITAPSYAAKHPKDPQYLRPDETMLGLYQTMMGLAPIVIYYLQLCLFDPVFKTDTLKVALTNLETMGLEYRELSSREMSKFNSTTALESWMSRFSNDEVREDPIYVTDITGKKFYLALVYDTGDTIALFRNIRDIERQIGRIDRSKVHPLTWVEAFYMTTTLAAEGRHVLITRYPVIQNESDIPTKIHLATTRPARVVKLHDVLTDTLTRTYAEYPIFGNAYVDSTVLHLAYIPGLGAIASSNEDKLAA